jgi:hypothetical protein
LCPIYPLVVFQFIFVVAGGSYHLYLTFDSSRITRIIAHFKFHYRILCYVTSTNPVPEVPTPSVVPAQCR